MTRARNIAGFSTITTTPSPVHVGPIGVLTATRIDGEFNLVDLDTRDITAQGIGVTNLQVSGITTGLNVSGIITAQNGINFNGTSTGLNVSGVSTTVTLNATTLAVSGNATIDGNATIGGVLTYEDVTNVDSVGVITARTNINLGDSIIHIDDTNTKIRFPAADTVSVETAGNEALRVDSSGRMIIGDTDTDNAVTDSDNLVIGAASGDNGMTIVSQSGNYNGTIRFSDGANSGNDAIRGTIQYYHGEDYMRFYTNAAERMRITSTGSVGIGSDSPDCLLDLTADSGGAKIFLTRSNTAANNNDFGRIEFRNMDKNNVATIKASRYSAEDDAYIKFETQTTGGSESERLRIMPTGQINIAGNYGQTTYTLSVTGTINATSNITQNGTTLATNGKAIAMAMVFG